MTAGTPTKLSGFLETVLAGMRDARVSRALQRNLSEALDTHVRARFVPALADALGDRAGPAFEEAQGQDPDTVISSLLEEDSTFGGTILEVVARLVAEFVQKERANIIASMRAAGEGPSEEREGRLARAREAIESAQAEARRLATLSLADPPEQLHSAILPFVERLEEAREILAEVENDDAILGRTQRDGAYDVESLTVQAFTAQADLFINVAERIGPAIEGVGNMTFDQEAFVLDALVPLQEAVQYRFVPGLIMRLARVRAFKGDTGEAKAILERLLELDPEGPESGNARELLAAIEAKSLARKDSRCFVATAVMGAADAPEVLRLRAFRDQVLLRTAAGRVLVNAYYLASPPLARFIAGRPLLRRLLRDFVVSPLARCLGGREGGARP